MVEFGGGIFDKRHACVEEVGLSDFLQGVAIALDVGGAPGRPAFRARLFGDLRGSRSRALRAFRSLRARRSVGVVSARAGGFPRYGAPAMILLRLWAKAQAAGICWVVGVEQTTASQCRPGWVWATHNAMRLRDIRASRTLKEDVM